MFSGAVASENVVTVSIAKENTTKNVTKLPTAPAAATAATFGLRVQSTGLNRSTPLAHNLWIFVWLRIHGVI